MTDSSFSRRTMLGAAGALGVALLSACAGPGSTAKKPGAVQTGGEIKGKLSFAHWRAEDKAAFDALTADFKAKYPDTDITQDITPSNDYQSQALNRLKSGAIGDVFPTFRGAQFEQFVKAGVYADLTSAPVVGKYTKSLIEAGASGGKQWGLPYQIVFNMPVTNKDLMSSAGVTAPAKTWDEFLANMDKIKSKGVIPMAWPGGDIGNAGHLFNCMVANATPQADACTQLEKGTMKVTDSWFLDMLGRYAQLRPYVQPNAVGSAVEPSQQLFATGKAAMLATGSFHIAAVRKLGGTFPIDMYMTPGPAATYEGIYNATFILGINTASKVQPLAMAWLEFLSDPANAAKYANATVQHVSVTGVQYSNPDLQALAPWLQKKTMLAPRFQFNDLDIRNAVEGACIKVMGGTDPNAAAQEAAKIVAERVK